MTNSNLPKITFLGSELDNTKEHEIFASTEHKFGLKAIVKFKDERDGVHNFNNLTEVHYMYKTFDKPKVAFESELHHTGGTRELDRLESIEIVVAEGMAQEW